MPTMDKKECACDNNKVYKKSCNCCSQCGSSDSRTSESLEIRKKRLEKELVEVNQLLDK